MREFATTHRPRIIARSLRLHLPDTVNHKYRIAFTYVNIGESNASIKRVEAVLIFGENRWNYGSKQIRFGEVKASKAVVAPGEDVTDLTSNAENEVRFDWDNKDSPWHCLGTIAYTDSRGVLRKTGFCRRWNPPTMAWEETGDPEHEYSP